VAYSISLETVSSKVLCRGPIVKNFVTAVLMPLEASMQVMRDPPFGIGLICQMWHTSAPRRCSTHSKLRPGLTRSTNAVDLADPSGNPSST
jgi:hypothetical protein